jgi:hypothetical protein
MQIKRADGHLRQRIAPAGTDLLLTGRFQVRVLAREPSSTAVASPLTCDNAGREGCPMAGIAPSRTKINTEITQLAPRQPSRRSPGRVQPGRPARRPARVGGDARGSVRDPGRQVVELDCGITVYPPETEGSRGGRSSPRTGSGGTGRPRPRPGWPPSWRRSGNGWRPTRRTWSVPART